MRISGDTFVLLVSVLAGCTASNPMDVARQEGFSVETVDGKSYRHVVAYRPGSLPDSFAHVYIEGDGVPWFMGVEATRDPTPKNALALRLAASDDHDVIYVGRPCYFGLRGDDKCDSSLWTSGRYSEEIVDSMVATIQALLREHGQSGVILVGYSGGGVLATLIAGRLKETRGVLTVAANLDTDAWTEYHDYEPLTGSINPAMEERASPGVYHVQVIGEMDRNVPEFVSRAYQERHPDIQIWSYPDFDHSCCWEAEWASIVGRFYTFLARRESNQLID